MPDVSTEAGSEPAPAAPAEAAPVPVDTVPAETPAVPGAPVEAPVPAENPATPTPEEAPAQESASSPHSELDSATGAPAVAVPTPEVVAVPEAVPPPQGPADAPYDEGFSPNDVLAAAPQAPAAAPASSVRAILAKGLESIRFRKRAKLEKIVQLARKKGTITNDDVQLAVQVSDSTATRYLNQLVVADRLRRSGFAEHAVYEPI